METELETRPERSIESPGGVEHSRATSLSQEANALHTPLDSTRPADSSPVASSASAYVYADGQPSTAAADGAGRPARTEADQINDGLIDTASLYNQGGSRSAFVAGDSNSTAAGGSSSPAVADSNGASGNVDSAVATDASSASGAVRDSVSDRQLPAAAAAATDGGQVTSGGGSDQALRYVPSLEITDAGTPVAASGTSDHSARAAEMIDKVRKIEEQVTADIVGVGAATGGEAAGLKFNVKTHESLTRKLESEERDGKTGEINDVLRYTLTFPPHALADGANKSMQRLEDMGYDKIKVKNSFAEIKSPYRGINTTFAKDGQQFEVQFHTPESFKVKQATHKIYDIRRDLPGHNDGRPETGDRAAAKAKEYIGYVKGSEPRIDKHVSLLAASHGLEAGRISEKLVQLIEKRSAKLSARITPPHNIESVKNFRRGAVDTSSGAGGGN